jgi:hypothetical protein
VSRKAGPVQASNNLAWMERVAALITVEKTFPWWRAVTWATAAVLLALAVALMAAPHAVPGLVVPGGMQGVPMQ